MGIEIGAQLDALWRSLFLGAAFALLYDGLRALRLRRRTRRALHTQHRRRARRSDKPHYPPLCFHNKKSSHRYDERIAGIPLY